MDEVFHEVNQSRAANGLVPIGDPVKEMVARHVNTNMDHFHHASGDLGGFNSTLGAKPGDIRTAVTPQQMDRWKDIVGSREKLKDIIRSHTEVVAGHHDAGNLLTLASHNAIAEGYSPHLDAAMRGGTYQGSALSVPTEPALHTPPPVTTAAPAKRGWYDPRRLWEKPPAPLPEPPPFVTTHDHLLDAALAHHGSNGGAALDAVNMRDRQVLDTVRSEITGMGRPPTAGDIEHFSGRIGELRRDMLRGHAREAVDVLATKYNLPPEVAGNIHLNLQDAMGHAMHPGMTTQHIDQALEDYHLMQQRGGTEAQAYLRQRLGNQGTAQTPLTAVEQTAFERRVGGAGNHYAVTVEPHLDVGAAMQATNDVHAASLRQGLHNTARGTVGEVTLPQYMSEAEALGHRTQVNTALEGAINSVATDGGHISHASVRRAAQDALRASTNGTPLTHEELVARLTTEVPPNELRTVMQPKSFPNIHGATDPRYHTSSGRPGTAGFVPHLHDHTRVPIADIEARVEKAMHSAGLQGSVHYDQIKGRLTTALDELHHGIPGAGPGGLPGALDPSHRFSATYISNDQLAQIAREEHELVHNSFMGAGGTPGSLRDKILTANPAPTGASYTEAINDTTRVAGGSHPVTHIDGGMIHHPDGSVTLANTEGVHVVKTGRAPEKAVRYHETHVRTHNPHLIPETAHAPVLSPTLQGATRLPVGRQHYDTLLHEALDRAGVPRTSTARAPYMTRLNSLMEDMHGSSLAHNRFAARTMTADHLAPIITNDLQPIVTAAGGNIGPLTAEEINAASAKLRGAVAFNPQLHAGLDCVPYHGELHRQLQQPVPESRGLFRRVVGGTGIAHEWEHEGHKFFRTTGGTIGAITANNEVHIVQHGIDHAAAVSKLEGMAGRAQRGLQLAQQQARNPGLFASTGGLPVAPPTTAQVEHSIERGTAARMAAQTERTLVNTAVQLEEKAAPGLLSRMTTGAVEHAGGALSNVAHTASSFTGNLGKVALIGGAGIAAIALLSSLSSPRAVPKLPETMAGGADNGDANAMAFNQNPNVGVGAVAMPAVGQQAQMGSWVSRLPSLDDTLAMGNAMPPPTSR